MKIDEKYFVPFLFIVAVMAAIIIVFFTVHNQEGREETFKKNITAQDSLRQKFMPEIDGNDSLRVDSFPDKFVIVDFWATWAASFTEKSHKQLYKLEQEYPHQLEILAAVVRDKPEKIKDYISHHNYKFHYVYGTKVFNDFHVPGVPTQLVYAPGGKLQSIFTGYADSTRMDSLKTMIGNGK